MLPINNLHFRLCISVWMVLMTLHAVGICFMYFISRDLHRSVPHSNGSMLLCHTHLIWMHIMHNIGLNGRHQAIDSIRWQCIYNMHLLCAESMWKHISRSSIVFSIKFNSIVVFNATYLCLSLAINSIFLYIICILRGSFFSLFFLCCHELYSSRLYRHFRAIFSVLITHRKDFSATDIIEP